MSTGQTSRIESTSLDVTLEVAERMGRKMRGGEVVELISDLGGGKTAFVRGLAAGLGSHDAVRSPSFTIANQYRGDKLTLHHFDFYRLHEPGIMRQELAEVLDEPATVIAVEWADIVQDVLPAKRLSIRITATEPESRQLDITYPMELAYLLPANT